MGCVCVCVWGWGGGGKIDDVGIQSTAISGPTLPRLPVTVGRLPVTVL